MDDFMEENGLGPLSQKEIRASQYKRSPRNLKYSHLLATKLGKKINPLQKKYLWVAGKIYHTNTTNLLMGGRGEGGGCELCIDSSEKTLLSFTAF